MSRWTRFWSVLLMALFTALAFTGCNTIEGAGEDIEAGGEQVQEWAD